MAITRLDDVVAVKAVKPRRSQQTTDSSSVFSSVALLRPRHLGCQKARQELGPLPLGHMVLDRSDQQHQQADGGHQWRDMGGKDHTCCHDGRTDRECHQPA
jgi:hypothetical protein